MTEFNLLTADEAAKLLRIGRRTFDGHVVRGDVAYIAVGLDEKRVRKRFDPEGITWFRDRQRRVGCPPEPTRRRRRTAGLSKHETLDFEALLQERRAACEPRRRPLAHIVGSTVPASATGYDDQSIVSQGTLKILRLRPGCR